MPALLLVAAVVVVIAVWVGLHAFWRHRPPARQIERARRWRHDAGPG